MVLRAVVAVFRALVTVFRALVAVFRALVALRALGALGAARAGPTAAVRSARLA